MLAAHQLNRDHGFANHDIQFKTLSAEPSPIGGAQYLHLPMVDEDAEPDAILEFIKIGSPEGYAEKVYGSGDVPTSWGEYGGQQKAWRLQQNYTALFSRFSRQIEGGFRATPASVHDLLVGVGMGERRTTLVLSSVPASHICKRPDLHSFGRANILIKKEKPDFISTDNVVIYSGRPEEKWYRACKLFGQCWTEYAHFDAPDGGYITGFKPLGTDCNCFPTVHRIGRFGTWDRKVLLTDVTTQVNEAVAKLEMQP